MRTLIVLRLNLLLAILPLTAVAQINKWQQKVDYTMALNLDVETHRFTGTQKLIFTNNSPDTLTKAYYHLYFNAFQPGSMMDIRSRNIEDPDRRVGDRISRLGPDEIGEMMPTSLLQDGQKVSYSVVGTVLEVNLAKPVLPRSSTVLEMEFKGQVPVQIRRTGRHNR